MSGIKTKTFVVALKSGQSKYPIFAENQGNMYSILDITVNDWTLSDPVAGAGGGTGAVSGKTIIAATKKYYTGEEIAHTDVLNSCYIVLRENSDLVHEYIPVAEILNRMTAKGERFPVNRNIDLNKSELYVGNKSTHDDGEVVVISVSYLENN